MLTEEQKDRATSKQLQKQIRDLYMKLLWAKMMNFRITLQCWGLKCQMFYWKCRLWWLTDEWRSE